MATRRILFTDGSYLNFAGDLNPMTEQTTYAYEKVIVAARTAQGVTTLWAGDKVDLDGNIWRLDAATGRLQIIRGNSTIYNTSVGANYPSTLFFYVRNNMDAVFIGSFITVDGDGGGWYIQDDRARFLDLVSQQPRQYRYFFDTAVKSLTYYSGITVNFGGLGGGALRTQYFTSSVEDLNDPYTPGGESTPGGGTGDFDGTSDSIDFPNLPQLSAVDTGFITLFNPTASQLKSLANYMWSSPLFDLNAWRKIFADPMDAILGLSIVPVAVPDGGQSAVTVGNISTGVSMTKAAAQYVEVDCGTLNVNEYWGCYLDYDPHTRCEIYLPYVGTHAISTDDIMGKPVHLKYHIDILSGACCAYVKCGSSVLYTFAGQCTCSIPITGNDWTNVVNGALSIAASVGSMVATGGASAPIAASVASTAINSMKPRVEKSGSMGGMGGMLGIQTPYLILTRPRQALPSLQNKYLGYPSFMTRRLSTLSGYTEVSSIHLEGIEATEDEKTEIESLLKGGVIL